MSKERMFGHHTIPVSIGAVHYLPSGHELHENIMQVTAKEHESIHKTLDIPYSLIREFRKRHEWKLYKDVRYFEDLAFLQNSYFQRMEYLTETLQERMFKSLHLQVPVIAREYHFRGDIHQNAQLIDPCVGTRFYLGIYQKVFIELSQRHGHNKFAP